MPATLTRDRQPSSPAPVRTQILGALGWLGITFVAATLGAMASVQARSFYESLVRPAWAPPGWLFGPVWTTLYFAMAVAAWLVWRVRGWPGARGALTLFLVQLAANALWSWLFFVWRSGAWATAEVVVLWGLIVATMVAFARVQRAAAWLLAPYLAWVTFATALCFTTWRLNPGAL